MNNTRHTQRGASGIGLIIFLAILGAGIYIGLQYVPQAMEANSVDTILSDLEKASQGKPFASVKAVEGMIDRQLDMNQMHDMREHFSVTQDGSSFIVKVNYEREMNLIYEKKLTVYEKTITLK